VKVGTGEKGKFRWQFLEKATISNTTRFAKMLVGVPKNLAAALFPKNAARVLIGTHAVGTRAIKW
jgi:hypothetical protein